MSRIRSRPRCLARASVSSTNRSSIVRASSLDPESSSGPRPRHDHHGDRRVCDLVDHVPLPGFGPLYRLGRKQPTKQSASLVGPASCDVSVPFCECRQHRVDVARRVRRTRSRCSPGRLSSSIPRRSRHRRGPIAACEEMARTGLSSRSDHRAARKVIPTRNSAIAIRRLRAKSAIGCSISSAFDLGDHRPLQTVDIERRRAWSTSASEEVRRLDELGRPAERCLHVVVLDRLQ